METGCIFCNIVFDKKLAEVVKDSDTLLAFKDIKPKAPVHLLIVPKKHVKSIAELAEEDRGLVSDMVYMAKEITEEQGLNGYQLTVNVGRAGGQIVDHLHLHLLGGWNELTSCD